MQIKYYECESCDSCGTLQTDNSRSFCVTALDDSGETPKYELPELLFKKVATSKKEIVVNKWEIYDTLNNIVSMIKQ